MSACEVCWKEIIELEDHCYIKDKLVCPRCEAKYFLYIGNT